MPRYWLGPWVWSDNAWNPPADSLAALDLRNRTACATPVTPLGDGLFVTPNATNLGASYTNLGTDPDVILSGAQKLSWQARFLLPNSLVAQTLREALWETLTIQADPTGEDRCKPIVPTTQREFELWLGGTRIFSRRFAADREEWTPVIDMLKRQYRAIRQQCLDGELPAEHYRKVCGYWVRKYRLHYREFQPSDLPDEEDVPPTTTVSDNFDRANESLDVGNWTEDVGPWSVTTNQCRCGGTGGGTRDVAHYLTNLSSDDHYVQAKHVTATGGYGVLARFVDLNDFYFSTFDVTGSSALQAIWKDVAGTETTIASTTIAIASSSICKLQVNGSSLEIFDDGASVVSGTDTTHSGQLLTGLTMSSVTDRDWDDFEAADLPLAAAFRQTLLGVGK